MSDVLLYVHRVVARALLLVHRAMYAKMHVCAATHAGLPLCSTHRGYFAYTWTYMALGHAYYKRRSTPTTAHHHPTPPPPSAAPTTPPPHAQVYQPTLSRRWCLALAWQR